MLFVLLEYFLSPREVALPNTVEVKPETEKSNNFFPTFAIFQILIPI